MMITRRGVLIGDCAAAVIDIGGSSAQAAKPDNRRSSTMDIDIKRNGSRPPPKGRPTGLPGRCASTPFSRQPQPARAAPRQVTFEPGARTAWHTHPLGQTLIVTAGLRPGAARGRPRRGNPRRRRGLVSARDKHWHGAAPTTAMTHIAIQEPSTARTWTGWRRSATSSTASDRNYRACDTDNA